MTNLSVTMLGNGAGSFNIMQTIPGSAQFGTIVTGDFTGDGHVDVATVPGSGPTIDLFAGNGDGMFATSPRIVGDPSFLGVSSGAGLATGDFNADGKPDLALVTGVFSGAPGTLRVFVNQGGASFSPALSINVPGIPTDLAVGDFDSDGKLDTLVSNGASLIIYLGNGDGSQQQAPAFDLENFQTESGPTIADLDADGRPDIIAPHFDNNMDTAAIFLNGQSGGGGTTAALTPTLAGKLPASVIAGQKAVISETVTLTNSSGAAYNASGTGKLFLSTGTTVDANAIALPASITKTLKLKAGAHTAFKCNLKSLPATVPNGTRP